MTRRVCTRDDFARAVLEQGLRFPLGPRDWTRVASEAGFLLSPERKRNGPDKELREADAKVARLNADYTAAMKALAAAQREARGDARIVLSALYQRVEGPPAADSEAAHEQLAEARLRVATVEAAHQAAVEQRSRLLARAERARFRKNPLSRLLSTA